MKLFEDKEKFEEYLSETSEFFQIDKTQIEKDYFVVLLLKRAFQSVPGLVFKGGTSLLICTQFPGQVNWIIS